MLTHPLFFEIATAPSLERAISRKAAVEKWRKLQAGEKLEETDRPIQDYLAGGYIFHQGGARLGNVS